MTHSLKKAIEKAKREVNKNSYSITDLVIGTAYEFYLNAEEAKELRDKIADYIERHSTSLLYTQKDANSLRLLSIEDYI